MHLRPACLVQVRVSPNKLDLARHRTVTLALQNFVPSFVPNRPEISSTQEQHTILRMALQSQKILLRSACKAVYTGSIPVVASRPRWGVQ
jgi:hypothetical protein